MTAYQNYQRAFNSIHSASKHDLSVSAWRERTQRTRGALLELRREHDAEIAGMSDTWAQRVIDTRKAEMADEFAGVASIARQKVRSDLDEVLAAKRERLTKAAGAPSEEQTRLLTVLSLRQNLNASELALAIENCKDSVSAINTLAEIASKHHLTCPHIDVEAFENSIAEVQEYANTLISEIDKPDDELGYFSRLFWTTNGVCYHQPAFDMIDNLTFTEMPAPEAKTSENAPESEAEASKPEGKSNE